MVQPKSSTKRAKRSPELPDVYQEMLVDAGQPQPSRVDEVGKTNKKRRIEGQTIASASSEGAKKSPKNESSSIAAENDSDVLFEDELFEDVSVNRQEIINSDSESAATDADWEEVDLSAPTASSHPVTNSETTNIDLLLGARDKERDQARNLKLKRPISAAEKRLRLEIHKMHLCCSISHGFIRSHWCNDHQIQSQLRKLLPSKTISYLNPDESKSQFQRSRSFMDGIEQATKIFRARFQKDYRGLSRATWAESSQALENWQAPRDSELPLQKTDFASSAQQLKASRDVGAQLFCAMLRSAGVDARLVFSLQCLPFTSGLPVRDTPVKKYAEVYSLAEEQMSNESSEDREAEYEEDHRADFNNTGRTSTKIRASKSTGEASRNIRESKYPIFWVEAFNEAVQKWVPVDALVTNTIAKPSKLEPPAGDQSNNLAYVIAFEDDGSARDVTRRYTKAYNAKTRRERVESTKGGQRWFKRVMRLFRTQHPLDREQVENSELASKEAAEPMPRNVVDFKNHPYYALERHMKRHEVIHPRREVGKLGASKSSGANQIEPIFRRRDVQFVQSADKWYRVGREIKPGEQALKRAPARRNRGRSVEADDLDDPGLDNAGVALYAAFQTSLYKAPGVVKGRLPKNVYGNLDIYVPSMVPPGATHIEHPETSHAAKLLGIDFADAVTGFSFKGRHGTAIVRGAVIADEYREAVLETIASLRNEQAQKEEAKRSAEAQRLWKRFLAGLRIRQRIEGYDIEGAREDPPQGRDASPDDEEEDEEEDEDEQGGFFPGQDEEGIAEPTADLAHGALAFAEDNEAVEAHQDDLDRDGRLGVRRRDRFLDDVEDDSGGGFLVEDDHDETSPPRPAESSEPFHPRFLTPSIATSNGNTNSSVKLAALENEQPLDNLSGLTHQSEHAPPEKASSDPLSTLSKRELAEARLLQKFYDLPDGDGPSTKSRPSTPKLHVPPEMGNQVEPKDNAPNDLPMSSVGPSPAVSSAEASLAPSDAHQEDQKVLTDSESEDKGSLLSEDPEEEDADPDWLAE